MTQNLAALFFLLAPLAGAQSVNGTYRFTIPQTQQSMQQAATVIRTVADVPQLSIDAAQATFAFNGPPDKVALALWLLPQLDRTAGDAARHVYPMASGEVAQVNFLPNLQNETSMQELLTVLRTVADIQKIFNFSQPKALVLRGKEGDVAFAEWIIDQLNPPAQQKPDATPHEFTANPSFPRSGTAARVNYLMNVQGAQGIQELLTVLRTVANIQKIFTFSQSKALVLRSNDIDIARAEWLIRNLDQPTGEPRPGTYAYTTPSGDDVTRIFYIRNATGQSLNAGLSAIRSKLNIRKAFYVSAPAALIVRGTTDQVEAAAQFIAGQNGLALR